MENQMELTEFILLGLSSDEYLQVFLFLIFLVIFLVTLLGNTTIIMVTKIGSSFHRPMFFFLGHLAFADICCSSVTVPKLLEHLITERQTISRKGCIAQIFFFFQIACAEVFILSAMAYDRYVAVCDPLHYIIIMKKEICGQLVGGAWIVGFVYAMMNALPIINLHFCGNNTINHYSCELPLLLVLSCSQTFTNYTILHSTALFLGFISFLFTLISYIYIISTILKIQSAEGRQKAFSTCSSHLIVVVLFYVLSIFSYMKPNSEALAELDKITSIQYSILTPMLNPFIYSLKNKDIKMALAKIFGKSSLVV